MKLSILRQLQTQMLLRSNTGTLYTLCPSPRHGVLTLTQPRQRLCLLPCPFIATPASLPPPQPLISPWRRLICNPLLQFYHFKNVRKMKSYNTYPFGILFFTQHNSLGILPGYVYQQFLPFYC